MPNKTMQLINIARNQLGIDDDTWRGEILPRHGGKADASGRVSLKSLSPLQQGKLLAELERKGFNNTAKAKDWRAPRIAKIKALWKLMHEAEIVHDGGEQAMLNWCKSITKTEKLEWAQSAKLDACVEGLKAWAKREGYGVRYVGAHRHTELYRLEA